MNKKICITNFIKLKKPSKEMKDKEYNGCVGCCEGCKGVNVETCKVRKECKNVK